MLVFLQAHSAIEKLGPQDFIYFFGIDHRKTNIINETVNQILTTVLAY